MGLPDAITSLVAEAVNPRDRGPRAEWIEGMVDYCALQQAAGYALSTTQYKGWAAAIILMDRSRSASLTSCTPTSVREEAADSFQFFVKAVCSAPVPPDPA